MLYNWKVRFLKTKRGNLLWQAWRAWLGDQMGDYKHLPDYIRTYAPGQSFVDVGCMWGVNGEYAFVAEEAGATLVKAVDVFGPTPEFETKKASRQSKVEFILGDANRPEIAARIGLVDVVLCAGVLYHHPSPFDLLVALRRICGRTLILRTWTIPEISGFPNGAVYFPFLKTKDRCLWNLEKSGVGRQVGITDGFEPREGYGNWFWGLTPTCVASLIKTAGFQIDHSESEAFVQTFICSPVAVPFDHYLPGEAEARDWGATVSAVGMAYPG